LIHCFFKIDPLLVI